jgi:hypothetical protein
MEPTIPRSTPSATYRFGLYDPLGDGVVFYKTAEDRDKAAEIAIEGYLDDVEWDEGVKGILAFDVTHRVSEVDILERKGELDDDGYDENGEHWPSSEVDMKCNYRLMPISDNA